MGLPRRVVIAPPPRSISSSSAVSVHLASIVPTECMADPNFAASTHLEDNGQASR